MDAFQKILARVATQLRDLTLSQRLVILLGGVLVAGSLVWLGQWAAQPEMVPLLEQNLGAEEQALIRAGLDTMHETYKVSGQQILVRGDANRQAILAQLQQQERMPADTSISFNALVKEANPWISQEEHDRRWTIALQSEIESVLKQFADVKQARVFLNLSARNRGFSREQPASSASVTLIMKSGQPVTRQLARAAARLVSGAVRGLPLKSVQVVDGTGASALEWEEEEAGGSNALHHLRREMEKQLAHKIQDQLAFDPKVRVNVQVELDLTSRTSESVTPTDPVDVSEERSFENRVRAGRSGQPGVQPNVGIAAGGGGADETSTVETNKTERVPGKTTKSEIKPSGEIQSSFAAINISYSYLLNVFRRQNTGGGEPTADQITGVFQQEKTRVVSQITALVKPQSEEQIRVDWYYDAPDETPAGTAGGSESTLTLAQKYAPHAGLAALAVVSLGLMFRMARQSGRGEGYGIDIGLPKEAIEAAKKAERDLADVARRKGASAGPSGTPGRSGPAAASDATGNLDYAVPLPVGNAAGTEGVLEAREVDETTVQVNKMLDQLSQMVDNDSESVTTLLEHWIKRTD